MAHHLARCALLDRQLRIAIKEGIFCDPRVRQLRKELRQECEWALLCDLGLSQVRVLDCWAVQLVFFAINYISCRVYLLYQSKRLDVFLWHTAFYRVIEDFRGRLASTKCPSLEVKVGAMRCRPVSLSEIGQILRFLCLKEMSLYRTPPTPSDTRGGALLPRRSIRVLWSSLCQAGSRVRRQLGIQRRLTGTAERDAELLLPCPRRRFAV